MSTDELFQSQDGKWAQNRTRAGAKRAAASTRRAAEKRDAEVGYTARDIQDVPEWSGFRHIDFSAINWERRLACKKDPLLDLKTYFPRVFYLEWASFHRGLVHAIEERIRDGGKKAFGCPRGSGKTAIVRGMIIRATKYAMRNFCFFVGTKEDKALQTLSFIKGFWYRSPLLQQDFPEIAYPVYRIEGRSSLGVHAQLYKRERTHLVWAAKEIRYPCLQMDEEDAAGYLKHDPDSIVYLPDIGIDNPKFVAKSAGTMIRAAGVDGSIRGEAEFHPIFLTQPRPDFVLLDDIQKEQKAQSPKACDDLERLIESAISYLNAPDIEQACLMPCTVIREDDVSDKYLNRLLKPEYMGERHGVITKYPPGIDDDVILDEIDGKPNVQGELWLQYKDLRNESLRKHGTLKLANDHYRAHREVMDKGFIVSWSDRFKNQSKDLDKNEISALQAAMNWRFRDHLAFLSEGQNKPKSYLDTSGVTITADELAEKTTSIPRGIVSAQWTNVVCFVDVQDEVLFYAVFAHDMNFNGQFIDYGTYPKLRSDNFTKNQLAAWFALSKLYYKEHRNERPVGYTNRGGSTQAPFDAKIYLALKECCDFLLKQRYPRQDQQQNRLDIRGIAIDAQWGKAAEVIKRFCREYNDPRIIAYNGHAYYPSYRQLEEYSIKAGSGEVFEHQLHPHLKEAKYMVKPYSNGGRYLLVDTNRLKTFLIKRLATPMGSDGCVTLFEDDPMKHRMFAGHVASSEYPEPVIARGVTKECWKEKPGWKDNNDFLDCATGCMCLASLCGASIKHTKDEEQHVGPLRPSISEAYRRRKVTRRT